MPEIKLHEPERRDRFLTTLAATGNVTASARAAQVSRTTVYTRRHAEPDFAAAWDDALAAANDEVLAKVRERVLYGDERPLVSGGKLVKDDDGKVVTVREYDFRLVELYLKAMMPHLFGGKCESGGKTTRGADSSKPAVRVIIANDAGPEAPPQAGDRAAHLGH